MVDTVVVVEVVVVVVVVVVAWKNMKVVLSGLLQRIPSQVQP